MANEPISKKHTDILAIYNGLYKSNEYSDDIVLFMCVMESFLYRNSSKDNGLTYNIFLEIQKNILKYKQVLSAEDLYDVVLLEVGTRKNEDGNTICYFTDEQTKAFRFVVEKFYNKKLIKNVNFEDKELFDMIEHKQKYDVTFTMNEREYTYVFDKVSNTEVIIPIEEVEANKDNYEIVEYTEEEWKEIAIKYIEESLNTLEEKEPINAETSPLLAQIYSEWKNGKSIEKLVFEKGTSYTEFIKISMFIDTLAKEYKNKHVKVYTPNN